MESSLCVQCLAIFLVTRVVCESRKLSKCMPAAAGSYMRQPLAHAKAAVMQRRMQSTSSEDLESRACSTQAVLAAARQAGQCSTLALHSQVRNIAPRP